MKVRKIKAVLLAFGFGFFVLGLVLFFVTPIIIGKGFEYSGLEAFLSGLKKIVSFDFGNVAYTLIFVLMDVTIVCAIIWAIFIIVFKRWKSLIALIFTLISLLILETVLMVYFAATVQFNGKSGKLLSLIIDCNGQGTGKLLTVLVLTFMYLSLMLLTLNAFMDIIGAAIKGKEKAENKTAEISVQEQVAGAPIQADPTEGIDDRKAREEEFFKACLATGEFEQYDEVELAKPILSKEAEPVFELTEVEEKDVKINRHNYVRVTTKRKISNQ